MSAMSVSSVGSPKAPKAVRFADGEQTKGELEVEREFEKRVLYEHWTAVQKEARAASNELARVVKDLAPIFQGALKNDAQALKALSEDLLVEVNELQGYVQHIECGAFDEKTGHEILKLVGRINRLLTQNVLPEDTKKFSDLVSGPKALILATQDLSKTARELAGTLFARDRELIVRHHRSLSAPSVMGALARAKSGRSPRAVAPPSQEATASTPRSAPARFCFSFFS